MSYRFSWSKKKDFIFFLIGMIFVFCIVVIGLAWNHDDDIDLKSIIFGALLTLGFMILLAYLIEMYYDGAYPKKDKK